MDKKVEPDDWASIGMNWLVERFSNRMLRRGFMSPMHYGADSPESNHLLKNFEDEVRSRAESANCEHCRYMAESISTENMQAVVGWRVKLDFELLQSCSALCSLCHFILRFIEQDESFLKSVKSSSKKLRIVSNFIGELSQQKVSNEDDMLNGKALYPQLTATFAPDLEFKNVRIGRDGLVWPLHGEGILPYETDVPNIEEERSPFTGRLIREEIDIQLLSSWLRTCTKEHGASCQPQKLLARPGTRLRMIDVARSCVVFAEHDVPFIALSYVWGPKAKYDRLVLTKDTAARLMEEGGLAADIADVPQTFRDAIVLANRLGFKYLWIDAICIQQDDPVDLEAQMMNMDQIYSCAALTIVSDTTSSDSGLPGVRPSTRKVDQQVYKGKHVSLITTRSAPWSDSEASPWSTRGWTLQEDVLSRRLLVFNSRQVFYNCRIATYVEHTTHRTPKGLLPVLDAVKGKQEGKGSFFWRRTHQFEHQDASYDLAELKPFSPLTEYQTLFNAYARRLLTNNEDAINGFAGILASLVPELGDHFWGLPVRHFTQVMHWQLEDKKAERNVSFPSWSWAGWINGKGQQSKFLEVQTTEPLDYLIDWYRLSEDGKEYVSLNDELKRKRGHACNHPLLNPPKRILEWARSKDKSKGKREPMLYTAPDMTAFDLSPFGENPLATETTSRSLKSHILRFWAIGVVIAVNRSQHSDENEAVLTYNLNVPGDKAKWKLSLGSVYLRKLLVASQPPDMEFIILSRLKGDNVILMLVERIGEIVYRVQLIRVSTTNEVWKKLQPQWKLYNLG